MTTMLKPESFGETALNTMQIDGLLTGNTAYMDLPPGGPGGDTGGVAPFLFGTDGVAAVKFPSGKTQHGRWRIADDHYCVDWDGGLQNSCTRLVKSGGAISLFDAAKGALRGHVRNIVPGNPENL